MTRDDVRDAYSRVSDFVLPVLGGLAIYLFLTSPVLSQYLLQWEKPRFETVEIQCQICGRSIFQNRDVSLPGPAEMPISRWDDHSPVISDSLKPRTIRVVFETDWICQTCELEWRGMDDYLRRQWNDWLKSAIKGKAAVRARFDERRRVARVREIDREIQTLRDSLDHIRGRK